MTIERITDLVKSCIASQIGCTVLDLEMRTELGRDLHFDELDFVEVHIILEKVFDITLEAALYAENSRTVGSLICWIDEITPQIVPDNNVDAIETQTEPTTLTGKETTLEALREANTSVNVCPLQALQQLCSESDINIEVQNCGDIYVHLAHSDESYKVKDMEELTSVLDAVKFLESFKGGE